MAPSNPTRPPIRQAIDVLLGLVLVALAAAWWLGMPNDSKTVQQQGEQRAAPFDWSTVSSRDLNIAAVFLTARDRGVRAAMDSLQAMAKNDSSYWTEGHMIAHALGRYAIAANRNNPGVLSQCRPTFQAGCYHGVLEGYMSANPHIEARKASALCAGLVVGAPNRFEARECAHGLGHGFAEGLGYDLAQSLRGCDAFDVDNADLRGECHDGVFMENEVHGLGMPTMNVGDSAVSMHSHMMMHAAPTAERFRASDLAFPCDSVATQYQPSCWAYQPLVIAHLTQGDLAKTLDACKLAPEASRSRCYRGYGKQSMAWLGWSFPKVIAGCSKAGAGEGDCLAGGVEALIDLTLTTDRATSFCERVASRLQQACRDEVSRRFSPVQKI
ncbi:MAG TPA: hypothetical protein VGP95_18875 [Gemmatimonadaceae bacterium]|nr:hypothetical protein [Gemmatimonadaceae bacterium]